MRSIRLQSVSLAVLAALALVLLPLMPNEPLSWMGDLSPQRGFMLVIVILVFFANLLLERPIIDSLLFCAACLLKFPSGILFFTSALFSPEFFCLEPP